MSIIMISMDTSSTSTGVAIWKNGILIERLSLTKPKKENNKDWMSIEILKMLDNVMPDIVIVEQEAVTRNMETVRVLVMIIGVIKGWCIAKGVFFDILKPTIWRKAVAGKDMSIPRKRVDCKLWAIRMVKLLFNIEETDDVCEAILIGQAYINIANNAKITRSYE